MRHFLHSSWLDVGTTLAMTVGSPSVHRRGAMLKLISVLALILTIGVGNVWGVEYEELYNSGSFTTVSTHSYTQNKTFTLDSKSWTASVSQVNSSIFYLGCNSNNASKGVLNNNSTFSAIVTALKSADATYNSNYTTAHAYALLFDNAYNNVTKVRFNWSGGNNAFQVYLFGYTGSAWVKLANKNYSTSGATTAGYVEWTGEAANYTKFAIAARPGATSTTATNKSLRPESFIIYKTKAQAFTVGATSNNESYGTVSLSGSTITAYPKSGYRVSTSNPYSVSPANSATVNQSGNTFTVTASANTTVTINFEAIPTYTVTWIANGTPWTGSSHGTPSTNVESGSKVATLPTAPTSAACDSKKEFVGWTATEDYSNATTPPTDLFLTPAGAPIVTGDVTYHAVFANASNDFERITSDNISTLRDGNKVAIVCVKNSGALKTDGSVTVAPSESSSKITPASTIIWTIKGTSTSWTIENSSNQKLGTSTSGTPSSNSSKDIAVNASYNNTWKIQNSTNANNGFSGSDAIYISLTSENNCALEITNNKWVIYNSSSASSNQYTALKFYRQIYTNYTTTCCTELAQINGSFNLSHLFGGFWPCFYWAYTQMQDVFNACNS